MSHISATLVGSYGFPTALHFILASVSASCVALDLGSHITPRHCLIDSVGHLCARGTWNLEEKSVSAIASIGDSGNKIFAQVKTEGARRKQ